MHRQTDSLRSIREGGGQVGLWSLVGCTPEVSHYHLIFDGDGGQLLITLFQTFGSRCASFADLRGSLPLSEK